MRRAIIRAALVSSLIVVSACTADPNTSTAASSEAETPSTPAEPSQAEAPTATAVPALEPETTTFKVGTSGLGINHLPYLIAVDELKADGWDVEIVDLASGDLVVQGVVSGDFEFGNGQLPSVLLAQLQDAPLKMIAEFARNTWTTYATNEFPTCEALDGVSYAVHSLSSFTYHYPRVWIDENCAGTAPEWIIVPGSENRLAAMLSGEVQATSIELADAVTLQADGEGRFTKITSYAESLGDIITGTHWGNSDFMEANPNTTAIFLAAVLEQHRELSDPVYFEEQLTAHLPAYGETGFADEIATLYTDLEIFHPDGGLSEEAVEASLQFFLDAEVIEPGLTVDDVIDRTYLELALEQLAAE